MSTTYCAYDDVGGRCMRKPRASMAPEEGIVKNTNYAIAVIKDPEAGPSNVAAQHHLENLEINLGHNSMVHKL